MTKAQDTQRIILSRVTLVKYRDMAAAGVFPVGDLRLIADEIVILRRMAEAYPDKAEVLGGLIGQWEELRGRATN